VKQAAIFLYIVPLILFLCNCLILLPFDLYIIFFTFLSRKYMLCVLLDVEKLLASIIHKITSEYLQPLTYMGGSTDCTQRHPPLDCSTAGSIFEFVSTNYFLAYSNSYLN